MTILEEFKQMYSVEARREARADELVQGLAVTLATVERDRVRAFVNGHHTCEISRLSDGQLGVICTCQDWKSRGMGVNMPCKHILGLVKIVDQQQLLSANPGATPVVSITPVTEIPTATPATRPLAPPPPGTRPRKRPQSFGEQVAQAIGAAIEGLANLVEEVLLDGGIPFLIGSTGCGKTSATRLVATRNLWGFEEVAGAHSFADSDLVGLRTDRMEMPGIFARTFQRARNGEPVLMFLDELFRFNVRSMDILMRPLQIAAPNVAQAMGFAVDCPVRIVEAPLWGTEVAPAHQVHIVLAANPWGNTIDPALIRRVEPIEVEMAAAVADLFEDKIADAIRASWKSVSQGELPLPIEYQSLSCASSAADASFLKRYLTRLKVLDPAAAEGYRHLLDGIGLKLDGGGA